MAKLEQERLFVKFLQSLSNWNFTVATEIAKEIKEFPSQSYYRVKSLSAQFGNLDMVDRPGSAFCTIPETVMNINQTLVPWFKNNIEKGGIT